MGQVYSTCSEFAPSGTFYPDKNCDNRGGKPDRGRTARGRPAMTLSKPVSGDSLTPRTFCTGTGTSSPYCTMQRSRKCDLVLRKKDGTCFHARLESLRIDRGQGPRCPGGHQRHYPGKTGRSRVDKKSDDIHAANEKLTSIAVQLRKNESRLTTLLQEKEALLSEDPPPGQNNPDPRSSP